MIDFASDTFGIPLSVSSEHGLLHGRLTLIPGAPGLVVLVHAALALDKRDERLAHILRDAGLSTLNVDLLAHQEEHFPDTHNNVPLLAKRLLDFLGLIKTRMILGEIQPQPLGLCAANATSPVAVRVAALRDHDIAGVVCRGGLIDLAGVLYLRSLESPLLMVAEENDLHQVAASRRALHEIPGLTEFRTIPEIGLDYATSEGFDIFAHEAARWFLKRFAAAASGIP
ncbi:hypothetical protein [Propionivibrio soli]|uniref:hypothetical protein n=1 Tax=Propionivibrio soli TaxID=2976531 RepID=UPI0021E8F109|nr:hypothetical protein [Propionivibrio soli]